MNSATISELIALAQGYSSRNDEGPQKKMSVTQGPVGVTEADLCSVLDVTRKH